MADYEMKTEWAEPMPAAPQGAVSTAEMTLRKQLAELDDEVRVLGKRITRVLREPSPQPESAHLTNVADAPNRSEFALMLDDLRVMARRITVAVRDLGDRVDL